MWSKFVIRKDDYLLDAFLDKIYEREVNGVIIIINNKKKIIYNV